LLALFDVTLEAEGVFWQLEIHAEVIRPNRLDLATITLSSSRSKASATAPMKSIGVLTLPH